MSKRIRSIIISILSILLLLGIIISLYAFFDARNSNKTFTQSITNLFPIAGESRPDLEDNPINQQDLDSTNEQSKVFTDTLSGKKLTQISSEPVSGGFFASTSTVRYIEKATGHIYEYSFFTQKSRKITQTTIPKLHDIYWLDLNTFIARYLADDSTTIKSFLGFITNPGQEGFVSTRFLTDNIRSIDINGGKAFYIADVFPGSAGYTYTLNTNKINQIFTSNLLELDPIWHQGIPYVHTRPSKHAPGALFKIVNNNFIEEIGDVTGLMAHSTGKDIIISDFESKLTWSITNGEEVGFQSFLIPEKCVAIKSDTYCAISDIYPSHLPDSWHIGEHSFNDNLYRIEEEGGRREIFNLNENVQNGVDVINLSSSPDGEQILFMNKKDNSLWAVEI